MSERPIIPELVPQWTELGFTKRQAVRYIVDAHMRARAPRGKGRNAAKRAAKALSRQTRHI